MIYVILFVAIAIIGGIVGHNWKKVVPAVEAEASKVKSELTVEIHKI